MVKISVFSASGKTILRNTTFPKAKKAFITSKFKKGFIIRTTKIGSQVFNLKK